MVEIKPLGKSNFLSSLDLTKEEIHHIFDLAQSLKNNNLELNYSNKVLGLIFDKASTRTRVSFQVAMANLGGVTVDLNPNISQIGRGEPIKDTARVLSRYCDVLAIRTFKQEDLNEYANWSSIPVINALTDFEHPCQALADYFTIKENFGNLNDVVITYVGDGNNVANSLIYCGSILGAQVRIACPAGFEPELKVLNKAREINNSNNLFITNDVNEAIKGSNVIYTDVWSSMGQENESKLKDSKFKGFTVTKDLVDNAVKDAIVLHCLPAYRGKEITDDVIDSSQSRIYEQAENRMHVQQALLSVIL